MVTKKMNTLLFDQMYTFNSDHPLFINYVDEYLTWNNYPELKYINIL